MKKLNVKPGDRVMELFLYTHISGKSCFSINERVVRSVWKNGTICIQGSMDKFRADGSYLEGPNLKLVEWSKEWIDLWKAQIAELEAAEVKHVA